MTTPSLQEITGTDKPRRASPTIDVARVLRLHGAGMSWDLIAAELGVGVDMMRYRVDPEYVRRKLANARAARLRDKKQVRLSAGKSEHPFSAEQVAKLRATVPADTRGLTAWICGDPLPGRSALERQGQP